MITYTDKEYTLEEAKAVVLETEESGSFLVGEVFERPVSIEVYHQVEYTVGGPDLEEIDVPRAVWHGEIECEDLTLLLADTPGGDYFEENDLERMIDWACVLLDTTPRDLIGAAGAPVDEIGIDGSVFVLTDDENAVWDALEHYVRNRILIQGGNKELHTSADEWREIIREKLASDSEELSALLENHGTAFDLAAWYYGEAWGAPDSFMTPRLKNLTKALAAEGLPSEIRIWGEPGHEDALIEIVTD